MNGYALFPINSYIPLSFDSAATTQAIANQFFNGRMPSDITAIIQSTVAAGPTISTSVRNGLYLALQSNYYQILK